MLDWIRERRYARKAQEAAWELARLIQSWSESGFEVRVDTSEFDRWAPRDLSFILSAILATLTDLDLERVAFHLSGTRFVLVDFNREMKELNRQDLPYSLKCSGEFRDGELRLRCGEPGHYYPEIGQRLAPRQWRKSLRSAIRSLAAARSGRWLAAIDEGRRLAVGSPAELSAGRPRWAHTSKSMILALAIRNQREILIADHCLRVFDDAGRQVRKSRLPEHSRLAAFSRDGQWLAVATRTGSVSVFQVETRRRAWRTDGLGEITRLSIDAGVVLVCAGDVWAFGVEAGERKPGFTRNERSYTTSRSIMGMATEVDHEHEVDPDFVLAAFNGVQLFAQDERGDLHLRDSRRPSASFSPRQLGSLRESVANAGVDHDGSFVTLGDDVLRWEPSEDGLARSVIARGSATALAWSDAGLVLGYADGRCLVVKG